MSSTHPIQLCYPFLAHLAICTGCPEIDEQLVSPVISPLATAGRMEFYRGPTPGHLAVSGVQMTPPDPRPWPELDGGLFSKGTQHL